MGKVFERVKPSGGQIRQVVNVDAEMSSAVDVPLDPLLARTGSIRIDDISALYSSQRNRLVRLAFAITFDGSIAEEVVQDAFVGLQRNVAGVDNPAGYLQRSVINLSVNAIRRRRVTDRLASLAVQRPVASSPEIDEMWDRVARLPAKQRAVVVLRFWEDMSLPDIARVIHRPQSTVKTTLYRALQALKEELT